MTTSNTPQPRSAFEALSRAMVDESERRTREAEERQAHAVADAAALRQQRWEDYVAQRYWLRLDPTTIPTWFT
jgi:hypothetical protein